MKRIEFTKATKRILADRTGHTCAYPGCSVITSVRAQGGEGSVKTGWASHKIAASADGPRPASENDVVTPEQIRSIKNGIWLCVHHAAVVDKDPAHHQVPLLHLWQEQAEERAALAARYGRFIPVDASPDIVAPRARAFARLILSSIPPIDMRFMPDVRIDHLERMKLAIREVSPFLPDNPLHGIDPELFSVQWQVVADVSSFVDFVENSGGFERNGLDQVYVPHDRSEEGETVQSGHKLLSRIAELSHRIMGRWGRGEGYYPQGLTLG